MLNLKGRSPKSYLPDPNRSRFLVSRGGKVGALLRPGCRFARTGSNNSLEQVKIIDCRKDASGVPHVYFERYIQSNGLRSERTSLSWEAFLECYPTRIS